jgi:hypothetical protein
LGEKFRQARPKYFCCCCQHNKVKHKLPKTLCLKYFCLIFYEFMSYLFLVCTVRSLPNFTFSLTPKTAPVRD